MQQMPPPEWFDKTIEATEKRRDALIGMIDALVGLDQTLALPEDQQALRDDVRAVAAAYCKSQRLELAATEASLHDLQEAKKQADSPILRAVMQPRGRV